MTLSRTPCLIGVAVAAASICLALVVSTIDGAFASPDDGPKPAAGNGAAAERPEESPSDVTLLVSGREYGQLKPCGCTYPQMGGLERRAVLADTARRHAKAFAALSIGETLETQKGDRRQQGLKADLFRAALVAMEYSGQLLGPDDLEGRVDELMSSYGSEDATPRPPLNVMIKRGGPLALLADTQPVLRFQMKTAAGDLRVRAVSVVDPTVRDRLIGVGSIETVNPPASTIAVLPKEPGLLVVAAHGTREDLAMIVGEATAKADFAIVIDVAGEVASRKPARGRTFERGLLLTFDDRGKEVLLVRLHATGKGFTADADCVVLDPDTYERPDDPKFAAVTALFDVYRRQLRDTKVLERIGSLPDGANQPSWVGTAACAGCHPGIYEDWKSTPHAHAMKTLEDRDSAFDPECVVCHTVGWVAADRGGWGRRLSSFQTPEKSPALTDVGCETCHGPGSAHVREPARRDLFGPVGGKWNDDRMWRNPTADRCATCHDVDNSHGFHAPDGYRTYLAVVDHRNVTTGRTVVGPPSAGAGGKPPTPAPVPSSPPGGPTPSGGDHPPRGDTPPK